MFKRSLYYRTQYDENCANPAFVCCNCEEPIRRVQYSYDYDENCRPVCPRCMFHHSIIEMEQCQKDNRIDGR